MLLCDFAMMTESAPPTAFQDFSDDGYVALPLFAHLLKQLDRGFGLYLISTFACCGSITTELMSFNTLSY